MTGLFILEIVLFDGTDGRMDGWDGPQKCPLIFFIFDGWIGWMGGWMGVAEYQKCPSNFLILFEYIGNVYTYIYINVQSLSPTLLWVRKFDVKLESLKTIFKTLIGKCVFEKSC